METGIDGARAVHALNPPYDSRFCRTQVLHDGQGQHRRMVCRSPEATVATEAGALVQYVADALPRLCRSGILRVSGETSQTENRSMGDGYNWYLSAVKQGFDPQNEANTSRYVHEVLLRCLDWPFEAIVPQASKRGFIDYVLRYRNPAVEIHVEVKPLGATLRPDMIRKYLVKPGPSQEDLRVGALTNFREWWLFVAGPSVKRVARTPFIDFRRTVIETRSDIDDVDAMIGYRGNGELRQIRAAMAEAPYVIVELLYSDPVITAIRKELDDIREVHRLDVSIPQRDWIWDYVDQIHANAWDGTCPFSEAKFRQAVCSRRVAESMNKVLVTTFDSRSSAETVRGTIRQVLKFLAQPG